jgi:hypothetical protein
MVSNVEYLISAEKRSAGAGNGQHIRPDPSAPVSRKGVLTSLLTGKQMPIPDNDIVRTHKFKPTLIKHTHLFNISSLGDVDMCPSLKN